MFVYANKTYRSNQIHLIIMLNIQDVMHVPQQRILMKTVQIHVKACTSFTVALHILEVF